MEVNYYFAQLDREEIWRDSLLFYTTVIWTRLFLRKTIRPNCIYGDASIDPEEYTFFHCVRWRLERRILEAKVGSCTTVQNFCGVILSSEENWNSMTSYTEALLKSKKFDLDERSRLDG